MQPMNTPVPGCLPEDLFTYSLQQEDMDDCIKTKMAEMYSNGGSYKILSICIHVS